MSSRGFDHLGVNAFLVQNRILSKIVFVVRQWSSKSFYKTATKNALHSWEATKIQNIADRSTRVVEIGLSTPNPN